jgi:hypothetical protein
LHTGHVPPHGCVGSMHLQLARSGAGAQVAPVGQDPPQVNSAVSEQPPGSVVVVVVVVDGGQGFGEQVPDPWAIPP